LLSRGGVEFIKYLQQNKLDEAVTGFTSVLHQAGHDYLGVKYEAAAHYNLAIAYLRKNMEARAVIEFNAVMDTWPASQYARRAEAAIKKTAFVGSLRAITK